MIIQLGNDESAIIIRGKGRYQTIVPKNEEIDEASELAFMIVYALTDEECMRVIRNRWNNRINEIRSPN